MSLAENLEFEVLADGRLANLNDWSESVAVVLAAREGIELSEEHWAVINVLRDYYRAFNISPVKKLVKRELKKRSTSGYFGDDYLLELFPAGVLVQGTKIAGVPVPMMDAELERATYQAKAAPHVGHFVNSFEFNGESFTVSASGNLLEPHRWNTDLAAHMAEREGITLAEEHWVVLNFLREFYFTYGVTPMVKILMKYLAEDLRPEQAGEEYLYGLFPKGPSRQGSRIAGLPEPQGCIDSAD